MTLSTDLRRGQRNYDLIKLLIHRELLPELIEYAQKPVEQLFFGGRINLSINYMPSPVNERLPVLLVFDGTDSFDAFYHSLVTGNPNHFRYREANLKPYRHLKKTAVSRDLQEYPPEARDETGEPPLPLTRG